MEQMKTDFKPPILVLPMKDISSESTRQKKQVRLELPDTVDEVESDEKLDRGEWLKKHGKKLLQLELEELEMKPFRTKGLRRWVYWNFANILASAVCLIIGSSFATSSKPLHSGLIAALGFAQAVFCLNELCYTYTNNDVTEEQLGAMIDRRRKSWVGLSLERWWSRQALGLVLGILATGSGLAMFFVPMVRARVPIILATYITVFGSTHLCIVVEALSRVFHSTMTRMQGIHRLARVEAVLTTMQIRKNWWGLYWATFFLTCGVNYLVWEKHESQLGVACLAVTCVYGSVVMNSMVAALFREQRIRRKKVNLQITYKQDDGKLMEVQCTTVN